jgi:hypothetical protein
MNASHSLPLHAAVLYQLRASRAPLLARVVDRTPQTVTIRLFERSTQTWRLHTTAPGQLQPAAGWQGAVLDALDRMYPWAPDSDTIATAA